MTNPNAASEILMENRAGMNDIESSAEAPSAHQSSPDPIELQDLSSRVHRSNTVTSRPPTIRSSLQTGDNVGIASGGLEKSEAESLDGNKKDPAAGTPNTQRGYIYSAEPSPVSARRQNTLGIPRADLSKGAQKINAMGGGDGGFIGAFDYDKKYPMQDEYGKEMGPEARIWKIYVDEAAEDDRFRIENLRDTLDVILVFAGLFSAVVTTFVIHTVESLEDDWQMTTASVLSEMLCLQRSVAANTPPDSCKPVLSFDKPGPANPSTTDYAVNALFFISLAVALCTALAAVLAKQWLHHYLQPTPLAGSTRDRARKHQFRLDGFSRYWVESIIGLLPILIHVSLFLFFIGLGIFLSTLHVITTVVVILIIGTTLILYLISNVLPIFDIQCPYHTPLTTVIHDGPFLLLKGSFSRLKRLIPFGKTPQLNNRQSEDNTVSGTSLKEREAKSIKERGEYWDIRCLGWLQTTTTDAKVHMAACSAFAGLPRKMAEEATKEVNAPGYWLALKKEIQTSPQIHDQGTLERLARAVTMSVSHFLSSRNDVDFNASDVGMFVNKNLRYQSPWVFASLYSMQSFFHIPRFSCVGDEFPNFFVSFLLYPPQYVHPTVRSRCLCLAPEWGTNIKDCLTLENNTVHTGIRFFDREKSLDFVKKLVDLFDDPRLSFGDYLSAHQAIMALLTQIFHIPSIGTQMVTDIPTGESYNHCDDFTKWNVCKAISAIHILARLPLPVEEAELQMFGSRKEGYDHLLGYRWTPEDQIRSALSSALTNAIQSVLNSDKGPPPESWKVIFKVAYYAYDCLDINTEECIQALLDLGERVGGDPRAIRHLQRRKRQIAL